MAFTDDAIRERHGMRCRDSNDKTVSVLVWENDEYVCLDSHSYHRAMTPYQARYLAAKLYRLARRIKTRKESLEALPHITEKDKV